MNTAPAPSAADDTSRADGHAFRSGRRSASDASGAQAQLDSLARAGVVTHVIGHQEAIDPLFAVAQLRDLPEVRFVAAFREGVIALGCPGGLPEQLHDLAAPISIPKNLTATTHDAPPPDVISALDKISERLSQLEGPGGMGALNERLTALDSISVENVRLVGDLLNSTAQNRETPDVDILISALADPLRALKAEQENGLNRIAAPLAEISERLLVVEQQIDEARREAASPADPQDVARAAQITATVDVIPLIADRLERIEEGLKGAVQQGNGCFEDLKTRVDQVADGVAKPARESPQLTQIETTLEALRSELHESQVRESERLQEVKASIDTLASAPSPEDAVLTAMDAQFASIRAQFDAASPNGLKSEELTTRLDDLLELAKQPREIPDSAFAGLTDQLEAILHHVQTPAEPTDQAALTAALDSLKDHAAERTAVLNALGQINESVTNLAARPDPVLDLTAQRQSFAQFGTVMKMIVQRLEGSADQIKDCVGSISTQAEPSPDIAVAPQELDFAPIIEEIGALRAGLSDMASKHAQLDEINTTVTALANRPKPIVDLSEQRRSFAGFTSALATIVQRLETTADLFEAPKEGEPTDGTDILSTLIANLPEQIADRIPEPLDADQLVEKLSTVLATSQPTDLLLSEIRALPEMIGAALPSVGDNPPTLEPHLKALHEVQKGFAPQLDSLKEQVAALQNAEAPKLDLTEQRASFAMFSTALAAVVGRLETAISNTARHDDQNDVAAQLTLMQQDIRSLAPQTDQIKHAIEMLAPLVELPQQFAEVSARISAQPAPQLDLTAQHQSFARFATASQHVIARLEAVVEALPTQSAPDNAAAQAPLVEQVERLDAEIRKLSAMHEDATVNLTSFLEMLAGEPAEEAVLSIAQNVGAEKMAQETQLEDLDLEVQPLDYSQTVASGTNSNEEVPEDFNTSECDNQTAQVAFGNEDVITEVPKNDATLATPSPEPIYPSFEDLPAPMEDLRFCFAEVVANQLRESHLSTKKPGKG